MMGYKKKKYKFANAIEIEEYHDGKYGAPGQKREARKKVTAEQIEKRNQYNKEKRCRHRMRTYFDVGDLFVTLTYKKDERPLDMEEAKVHIRWLLDRVRRVFKKEGKPFLWIYNIEVGTKNGWHVHLVIKRITNLDLIIQELWKKGKVIFKPLYADGEFKELAAYMTKTPRTDTRLRESHYWTSRNMPIEDPKPKRYKRWKTWKDIKVPEGYYIDEVHEGINPITGYRYRTYTLLRTKRREVSESRNIHKHRKRGRVKE